MDVASMLSSISMSPCGACGNRIGISGNLHDEHQMKYALFRRTCQRKINYLITKGAMDFRRAKLMYEIWTIPGS